MQTFLPYSDFARCAGVLDDRRLGKQRVETLQIMQVLTRHRWDPTTARIQSYVPKGWRTHPAVLMWSGFEASLARYQLATCEEWTSRGFADTCLQKTLGLLATSAAADDPEAPPWLGDAKLHRSHQSNLIRKDPEFYGPRFPGVPPDLDYVWPTVSP
jgi:hypothetical protein